MDRNSSSLHAPRVPFFHRPPLAGRSVTSLNRTEINFENNYIAYAMKHKSQSLYYKLLTKSAHRSIGPNGDGVVLMILARPMVGDADGVDCR